MAERIDVGKLRGVYYSNDKDSYVDSSSLSDMKRALSADADSLSVDGPDETYDDIEDEIVCYIKAMPVAEYNDISNKNTKMLADLEIYTNLVSVIAGFSSVASLSMIILIYCDYFNLKYEKIINELPNGLKIKLYEELRKHTRNRDILDELFGFENTVHVKKLF